MEPKRLSTTLISLSHSWTGIHDLVCLSVNGGTLETHRTRIRLWGIYFPESDQLCRNDLTGYFVLFSAPPCRFDMIMSGYLSRTALNLLTVLVDAQGIEPWTSPV
jgi:hypothetical protein